MTGASQRAARTVYLNGKFLEHPITGTERFALEVTRRILRQQAFPAVLLLPRGVVPPDGVDPRHCRNLPLTGMAFEQLTLPVVTRGALLLNFGGPAPILKRRQLVTMHDATPFRGLGTFSRLFVAWYWLLYAVLTRTALHLVTVSRFSAQELGAVFGVPATRFQVVPCGGEHLSDHGGGTRPPGLPDVIGPFVLMLGTLARHKNVVPVARAIAATGTELVIAGSIGKQGVFSSGAGAQGTPGLSSLPGSVHLVGRVPDASIAWLYRHALVFVMPSFYEGFGIPVVEAQLAGCLVISSDAGSLPEVGAGSVLYFDPARPDDAATLVIELAGLDDTQRAAAVSRSLTNAQRFSWDGSAARIVQIVAQHPVGTPAVLSSQEG